MKNFTKLLLATIFASVFLFGFFGVVLADQRLDRNAFYVDKQFAGDGKTTISATLQVVSGKAYFYVENTYWQSLSNVNGKQDTYLQKINQIASEFDNNIYPKLTEFYGKPWEPGIDNDLHITFLLTPLTDGFGGYVTLQDQYPINEMPQSNMREMAYISASHVNNLSIENLRVSFAHEFVHLIALYQKEKAKNIADDIWTHEARAEYSSTILGYDDNFSGTNLERRKDTFIKDYSDPLGEWKNESADYAMAMMMAQYLGEQYGTNIWKQTLQNQDIGALSISEVLGRQGSSKKFQEVFLDFATANYINDISANPLHGYKNAGLKSIRLIPDTKATIFQGAKMSYDVAIKDFAIKYFKFDGISSNLKLNFSKQSADDKIMVGIISESANGTKVMNSLNVADAGTSIYLSGLGTDVKNFVIVPVAFGKMTGFDNSEDARGFAFSVESVNSVPATISQLSVKESFAQGGKTIRVLGSGFVGGTKVYFGDAEASIVQTTPAFIDVVVPAHIVGEVSVRAISPSGAESNLVKFNYYDKRADGSLVRALGNDKVFIVKNGYIRHIKDAKIFSFYGHLGFDKVKDISFAEISLYEESSLVKAEKNPKVYMISDINKHWLNITGEQFSLSGRKWDAIFEINTRELNFFGEGANILQ